MRGAPGTVKTTTAPASKTWRNGYAYFLVADGLFALCL